VVIPAMRLGLCYLRSLDSTRNRHHQCLFGPAPSGNRRPRVQPL